MHHNNAWQIINNKCFFWGRWKMKFAKYVHGFLNCFHPLAVISSVIKQLGSLCSNILRYWTKKYICRDALRKYHCMLGIPRSVLRTSGQWVMARFQLNYLSTNLLCWDPRNSAQMYLSNRKIWINILWTTCMKIKRCLLMLPSGFNGKYSIPCNSPLMRVFISREVKENEDRAID